MFYINIDRIDDSAHLRSKSELFYIMKSDTSDKYLTAFYSKGKTPTALIYCNKCDGIRKNQISSASISFTGNKEADMYSTSKSLIVGSKVRNLIESNKLTGAKFANIIADNYSNSFRDHINDLMELILIGRCYKVVTKSGREIEYCNACGKISYETIKSIDEPLVVEPDSWDGSDIFRFDYGPSYPIVTDRFMKVFTEAKVINVEFISLDKYLINDI